MKVSRNSVAGWLFATALVAFTLAPLGYLTNVGLTILMYFKFGSLIVATFLARFGGRRHVSWWFGVATFGWASILFQVPGLWLVPGLVIAPNVDLTDLANSAAYWIADLTRGSSQPIGLRSEAVVQCWLTIIAALIGGKLAYLCERHVGCLACQVEREDSGLSSPQ